MKKVNLWDIKQYMPCDLGYTNVKRKISQIVPSELTEDIYSCRICLDDARNSIICVGFCGHVFHRSCILKCMDRSDEPHISCPICRDTYWVQKLYKCTDVKI